MAKKQQKKQRNKPYLNLSGNRTAGPTPDDFNRVNILFNQGRFADAELAARKLTARFPRNGFALKMLGVVLSSQGSFSEAVDVMQAAIELLPNDAGAHNNLGITLINLGRMEEAEVSCRNALNINPDYTDAATHRATALISLGRLSEAAECYRLVIQRDPQRTDLLEHLGYTALAADEPEIGIQAAMQALDITDAPAVRTLFVECAKRLLPSGDDGRLRRFLLRALTEHWGRASELFRVTTDLVCCNSNISNSLWLAHENWPTPPENYELYGTTGINLFAGDDLLLALLTRSPVCNIAMERFLTMARRKLLDRTADQRTADGHELLFYPVMAQQCFINEYVFFTTVAELQEVDRLRQSVDEALADGAPIHPLWLAALGAYEPLCALRNSYRLLERSWPETVLPLLALQVGEPQRELELRSAIPQITTISDDVSLLVRSQYEENPYPRWIGVSRCIAPRTLADFLQQMFPMVPMQPPFENDMPDILIAGCGTGQHSIETALRFRHAQILAVDLSCNSLAYAKRKSQEFQITTIEYAQADLLELGQLHRSFDVIESVGVLHHLGDPWAGWTSLLSLLRPGGVMKLGFYSEAARQDVVRIRQIISEQGYGSTPADIRRLRQDLLDKDETDFSSIYNSVDFFTTSACRDLLFHIQEHRLSLLQIDEFLRANKLAFLGFEIEASVLNRYRERFPDDPAAVNLTAWQIFEDEHPNTFMEMYQFWIQKTT